MAIVDPVQVFIEHTVTIVNADAELRTLFARPTGTLIVPWESLKATPPVPMIAYKTVAHGPVSINVSRLDVQFSVFAPRSADCNKATKRLNDVLRTPSYASLSLDIARDPDSPPLRQWPDANPSLDNAAVARADIGITFLIPD